MTFSGDEKMSDFHREMDKFKDSVENSLEEIVVELEGIDIRLGRIGNVYISHNDMDEILGELRTLAEHTRTVLKKLEVDRNL
jgi:hypothetical protein